MEPNPATDPQCLRISDADRHRVSELLRDAAGEGRLDVEELEERLEATYAAKTYGDLVPITVDLPGTGVAPLAPLSSAQPARARTAHGGPSHGSSWAMMSETKRTGAWTLPAEHTAVAVMGSVVLDLRDAEMRQRESVINACAVMGSVEVVVDAWTEVVLEGVPIMGSFQVCRSRVDAEITPDSPVVRVKGLALMGSVEVKRKGDPRPRRKLLGG